MSGGIECRVCGGPAAEFGIARVLKRLDVHYFQCTRCRFVQTEDPYWLDEAYSTPIIAADVGAVDRNLRLAAITQTVIQQCFDPDGTFLDFGGGYGLFVRLMRDRGFDFRWHDRYASNLLSIGFEATPNDTSYQLITAFEVLEHLVDPISEVDALLTDGDGSLLCTTGLLPQSNPRPGEWWYYVPSGGQHISIFALESLRCIAERFNCRLLTDGAFLHLFTRRSISEAAFRFISRPLVSTVLNRIRRRSSLVTTDFERLTGEKLR